MAKLHERFPFELVILVGDNIYGGERAADFKTKFEIPYKPLLDRGVKFYASLGNHDARNQRFYKLFNMDGKLYYSFKAPKQNVRFFALETTYAEPEQMAWVADGAQGRERRLEDSVLPPPALFLRPAARVGHPAAHGPGAAVRRARRQGRLHRPRSLLRADQAAEGHRLLRRRVGRQAARRQHRSQRRPGGERLRHRPVVHGRRDRRQRADLQRDVADRRIVDSGVITRIPVSTTAAPQQ